jgi:hypothetical protein
MRARPTLAALLLSGSLAAAPIALGATSSTGGAGSGRAAINADAQSLLAPPTLVAPRVVTISPKRTVLKLNKSDDYIVRVSDRTLSKGAAIVGGHNVVLENATLTYKHPLAAPVHWKVAGLELKGQTGEMYVNGLRIHGPLDDGIRLDERGANVPVVLQKIALAEVTGSRRGYHADLLQTWAGPAKLVVDGYTGSSNYQGFFLTPNQRWSRGPAPRYFWLHNVKLNVSTGSYALWREGSFPIQTQSVEVIPNSPNRNDWLWPKPSTGDTTWQGVVAVKR